LPTATASEIARLKPSRIVVAGGPAAIADQVVAALKGLAGTVVRVSGADRYETSRKLASYAFPSASTALIASGDAFPDALSASAAAAEAGAPLILVGSGSRAADAPAASQAKSLKATAIRVVGGTAVVPEGAMTTLKASVADTRRVAGADRFHTSIEVARSLFSATTEQVFVVNGLDFPDGLVVAPLAGRSHSPVFLSSGDCVNREVVSEMDRLGASRLTLIGGTAALTAGVAAARVCA
jgi:putative cell wall-binding protein